MRSNRRRMTKMRKEDKTAKEEIARENILRIIKEKGPISTREIIEILNNPQGY